MIINLVHSLYNIKDYENINKFKISEDNKYIKNDKLVLDCISDPPPPPSNNKIYSLKLKECNSTDFNLKLDICIDSQQLEENITNLPYRKELFKIIRKNVFNMHKNIDICSTITNINRREKTKNLEHLPHLINLDSLFPHQLDNISWMNYCEFNKNICLKYIQSNIIKIGNIFADFEKERFYTNYIPYTQTTLRGAILADESGLGKTSSIINFINSKHKTNIEPKKTVESNLKGTFIDQYINSSATLIICSTNNLNSWKEEIFKYSNNPNITIINNKSSFEKTTYQNLIDSDYVIISLNIFLHNSFKDALSGYTTSSNNIRDALETMAIELFYKDNIYDLTKPIFQLIFWERVVIDDIHLLGEYKKINYLTSMLKFLKSNFIWCLTGYFHKINYSLILDILTDDEYIYDNNLVNMLKNKAVKMKSKEEIIDLYNLPDLEQDLVYLNPNKTEQLLYNLVKPDIKSCFNKLSYVILLNESDLTINDIENNININNQDLKIFYNNSIQDLENKLKECSSPTDLKFKINILQEALDKIEINYSFFEKVINKIKNNENEMCTICLSNIERDNIGITKCGHIYCYNCLLLSQKSIGKCAICRSSLDANNIFRIIDNNAVHDINTHFNYEKLNTLYGTKISNLLINIKNIIQNNKDNKIIIFSNWNDVILKINKIITKYFGNICSILSHKNKKRNNRIFIANYDVNVNSLLTDINYGILLDLADEYQEKKAVNLLHNIGQKRKVKIIRYIMRGIEDNK